MLSKSFIKKFLKVFLIIGINLACRLSVSAQITQADSILIKTEAFINDFLYKNHDTTYISNFSNQIALKILGVTKFTFFGVNDRNQNSNIRYRPDRQVNLGFGIAYKFFAIDVAFNVGLQEESELDRRFFDFQGRVFSSKHFFEAIYQYYYGYKITRYNNDTAGIPEDSRIRNDIRTINVGIQYLYAFNYGRFSLKAPFVQNEIQKKSAGSTIGGINFTMYTMGSDSSIVPSELQGGFDEKLYLNDINITSLVFSFGYMYSFVWHESFFITLGAIPGLSLNFGDYEAPYRNKFSANVSVRLRSMNAIGYNGRRFFTGLQLIADLLSARIDKGLRFSSSHGSSKLFVGYRFGGR